MYELQQLFVRSDWWSRLMQKQALDESLHFKRFIRVNSVVLVGASKEKIAFFLLWMSYFYLGSRGLMVRELDL